MEEEREFNPYLDDLKCMSPKKGNAVAIGVSVVAFSIVYAIQFFYVTILDGMGIHLRGPLDDGFLKNLITIILCAPLLGIWFHAYVSVYRICKKLRTHKHKQKDVPVVIFGFTLALGFSIFWF